MDNWRERVCHQELEIDNCGFEHDPECIVRSQWQKRSKNFIYLAYRWAVAIFTIAVVIESMYENRKELRKGIFFAYLTRWGITMNMIVGIYGAIIVTIWHFHTEFKECILLHRKMPTSFKIYWALHNIALVISFVISIVYWAAFHGDESKPVNAANILSHVTNSLIMLLDIIIVSYPMKLYHVIQPIGFGICYGIFSYIYYVCGGKDIEGNHFIYKQVDWRRPGHAFGIMVGTLVLSVIVHGILFGVYKLRVFIQHRYFSHLLPCGVSVDETTQSQVTLVF